MEIGNEIGQKIRSAIKAKLVELGAYVDDELPDYIMVMVANKKTEVQMADDLSLFLSANTNKFTAWLHGLLQKLQSITNESTGGGGSNVNTGDQVSATPTRHKSVDNTATTTTLTAPTASTTSPAAAVSVGHEPIAVSPESKTNIKPSRTSKQKLDDEPVIRLRLEHDEFENETLVDTKETKLRLKTTTSPTIVTAKDLVRTRETTSTTGKELRKVSVSLNSELRKRTRLEEEEEYIPLPVKTGRLDAKLRLGTPLDTTSKAAGETGVKTTLLQHRPGAIGSSVGAILKHLDELEEEYDPRRPAIGNVASVVKVERKSSVPVTLQANKSLLLKAMQQAELSVAKARKQADSSHHARHTSHEHRLTRVVTNNPQPSGTKSESLGSKPEPSGAKSETSDHKSKSRKSKRRKLKSTCHKPESVSFNPETSDYEPEPTNYTVEPTNYTIEPTGRKRELSVEQIAEPSDIEEEIVAGREIEKTVMEVHEVVGLSELEESEESDVEPASRSNRAPASAPTKVDDSRYVRPSTTIAKSTAAVAGTLRQSVLDSRDMVVDVRGGREMVKGLDVGLELMERDNNSLDDDSDEDELRRLLLQQTRHNVHSVKPTTHHYYEQQQRQQQQQLPASVTMTTSPKFVVTLNDDCESVESDELMDEDDGAVDTVIMNTVSMSAAAAAAAAGGGGRNVVRVKPQAAIASTAQYIHSEHSQNIEEPMQLGSVQKVHGNERCKFWPVCKNAEACPYHHPSALCKTFPLCRFGDACLFIHPNCKFDAACQNPQCPFTHSTPRRPAGPTSSTAVIQTAARAPIYASRPPAPRAHAPRTHAPRAFAPRALRPPASRAFAPRAFAQQSFAPRAFAPRAFAPRAFAPRGPTPRPFIPRASIPRASAVPRCKFFPNCTDVNCTFQHPKPCRYGAGCGNRHTTCPFSHPEFPNKHQLKWSASSDGRSTSS